MIIMIQYYLHFALINYECGILHPLKHTCMQILWSCILKLPPKIPQPKKLLYSQSKINLMEITKGTSDQVLIQ